MSDNLALIYLSLLVSLLVIVAFFLLRQVLRTRSVEQVFTNLQRKLVKEKGSAKDYYQLGSLFLDKKLYTQAITNLQQALKSADDVDPENQALIYNALGFAYFHKSQYDLAIRHYRDAIEQDPNYLIAFNNLGNAYEKKQLIAQAIEAYEAALKIDPKNKNAKRRIDSLRRRLAPTSSA